MGGIEKSVVPQGSQLKELIEKAKLKVNQRFLQRGVQELRRVLGSTAGRVVDMNQWDILMRRLGVSSPFVRHKMFEAIDTNSSNTVDFREFIDGLATLWAGETAAKVGKIWDTICRGENLSIRALEALVMDCGIWREGLAVSQIVHKLQFALDMNEDAQIRYDEFHLALVQDTHLLQLVDRIVSSEAIVSKVSKAKKRASKQR